MLCLSGGLTSSFEAAYHAASRIIVLSVVGLAARHNMAFDAARPNVALAMAIAGDGMQAAPRASRCLVPAGDLDCRLTTEWDCVMSCRSFRFIVRRPTETLAAQPHAMHDDGKSAGDGDLSVFHPRAFSHA